MGSSQSTPIELQQTPTSKATNKSKRHTLLKNHYNVNESKLINAFIIDFEREYPMQFPLDIIPIIIHYYNKITESNWFEISKLLSLNDFSVKNMMKYSLNKNTFQVKLKSNSTMYTLQIFKKRDLKIPKYSSHPPHPPHQRKLISTIEHPFILCLRNAFQTKTKLFLVRDSFCGKELFSLFAENHQAKFTDSMARFYTAEICLAIQHIHSLNIVYSDLSPSNIFLNTDGHIMITDIDIDISMSTNGYLSHSYDINPQYLAPEILNSKGKYYYTKMADWWSVGMILYEMIVGLPPFYNNDMNEMYKNILYKKVGYYRFMSDAAINIISKLLRKDARQRIGFEEIKKERYFECIDWDKLYTKEIVPPFVENFSICDTRCYNEEENYSYSFPENYECYQRRTSSSSILLTE